MKKKHLILIAVSGGILALVIIVSTFILRLWFAVEPFNSALDNPMSLSTYYEKVSVSGAMIGWLDSIWGSDVFGLPLLVFLPVFSFLLFTVVIVFFIRKERKDTTIRELIIECFLLLALIVVLQTLVTVPVIVDPAKIAAKQNYFDNFNKTNSREFIYKEMSVDIPWSMTKPEIKEIDNGGGFELNCFSNDGFGVNITLFRVQGASDISDSLEYFSNYVLKNNPNYSNVETLPIKVITNEDNESAYLDFSGFLLNERIYGEIKAFIVNNTLIYRMKLATKPEKLNSVEFETIDNSIRIDN